MYSPYNPSVFLINAYREKYYRNMGEYKKNPDESPVITSTQQSCPTDPQTAQTAINVQKIMTTLDQIASRQKQDGALATASRQQTNPTDPQILLNVQKIMTTLERIALRQDTDENLCQKFEEVASQLEHSILQLTLDEKHTTQMIQDMLNNVSAAMSILHGKVDTIRMQSIQPTIIPDEPPNALPDTTVDELGSRFDELRIRTEDPKNSEVYNAVKNYPTNRALPAGFIVPPVISSRDLSGMFASNELAHVKCLARQNLVNSLAAIALDELIFQYFVKQASTMPSFASQYVNWSYYIESTSKGSVASYVFHLTSDLNKQQRTQNMYGDKSKDVDAYFIKYPLLSMTLLQQYVDTSPGFMSLIRAPRSYLRYEVTPALLVTGGANIETEIFNIARRTGMIPPNGTEWPET